MICKEKKELKTMKNINQEISISVFFKITLTLSISLLISFNTYSQREFVHPGVVHTTEDLERMKNNINVEPWKTGYEILLDEQGASLDYTMQGPFARVDRNGDNFGEFNNDMDAVYHQSLQYYITGDERYAESVISIIEPWARTLTFISGNVPALASADRGIKMLIGAEILRYNYSGWTDELSQITEDFARNVLLPPLYVPDPTRTANQGSTQMAGAISVAVYLNDEVLFDQVINAFLNEPCAGISNTLPNGQNGDTGRDYGHPFGMILTLTQTAEAAHQQGIDLFSVLDNRVLALSEYWNALGLGVDVPYIPYGTCYDFFDTRDDSRAGGSDWNTNILLELINGAYNVRKGIPNPYTTQRINEIPVSINTFLFKKDGDNSTSVGGLAPHPMHTGITDNELISAEIGNPSNNSATYNSTNKTWTISSSNGDIDRADDNIQFAYKRMNTDATIIARVTNFNSSNENAKTGLMFRESLDNDADIHAVYGHNSGRTHARWRGQEIVNTDLISNDGSSTNSYREEEMPAWLKIEINEGRVSTFYAPDGNEEPEDEMWSPVSTAFFDQTTDYYLGIFAASNDDNTSTGTFEQVRILFDEGTAPICENSASLIEAECFDEMEGINNEGESIGSIRNGAWTKYQGIDLTGINSVELTASSDGVGGTVEFRLDAIDGELIGSVDVAVTGGWGNWQTFSANVSRVTGTHAIYTVFNGVTGWLYNIDQFSFSEDVVCQNTANHIEAECFDAMLGIQTENCSEGTLNVGYIENGDWLKYNALDLTGMKSIKARVSGNTTGSSIEVRLGSETGTLIGALEVSNTGGYQDWETDSVNIIPTDGVQDVYLVFTGGAGYLYNLNWLGFSENEDLVTGGSNSLVNHIAIYPNPAQGLINFSSSQSYRLFNSLGKELTSGEGKEIDLTDYPNGFYSIRFQTSKGIEVHSVIKQ